jgi:hypothetical protein
MFKTSTFAPLLLLCSATTLFACDDISSDEEAELAYLGLDTAVEKSLILGFDGFNAASSANIDAQSTTGGISGTIIVTGQVDQGASDNKGMRLLIDLTDYSDIVQLSEEEEEIEIVYVTDTAALPQLNLTLRNFPNGTLEGTLVGTFFMDGDVEGEVDLNLIFAGQTEADPVDPTKVRRVVGTTTITGTATAGDGVFNVNITR